jgi:sodium/potassium-transporting ATPase subunit alpha
VIDLGFELFMALSFAWDKPETTQGLMKLPPRKPVTETSIAQLRRQQARHLPDRIDEESGEVIPSTCGARLRRTLSNLVSASWWHEQMETTEGEILVDSNVLSWVYLEMGTIEAAGAFAAYFAALYVNGITPAVARSSARVFGEYYVPKAKPLDIGGGKFLSADEQVEALAQAQTCYYMDVMIIQLFNLLACKCRLRLPFGRYMFSNPYNFYGALGGFTLRTFVSYVPFMNVTFGTSYRTPVYLHLISAAFGVLLVLYATLRTLIRRRSSPIRWNPAISGLKMHAIVYSTGTKG